MRFGKRWMRGGILFPAKRYLFPRAVLKTPPIRTEERGEVTVCVLTSATDWLCCLWTLVSYYRFSGRRDPLLIYSDGSLSQRMVAAIKRVFPAARVLDEITVNARVSPILSTYPNCRRFRNMQPCAHRIIDFPIICGSPFILMLDSDVLFFRRPDELLGYLEHLSPGTFVCQEDCQHAYFASLESIQKKYGLHMPSRVNVGMTLADVRDFDHSALEQWLIEDRVMTHPWAEQTLWAMYASRRNLRFLSSAYPIALSCGIGASQVVKHYVKPIRDLLYTEGLPSQALSWRRTKNGIDVTR